MLDVKHSEARQTEQVGRMGSRDTSEATPLKHATAWMCGPYRYVEAYAFHEYLTFASPPQPPCSCSILARQTC